MKPTETEIQETIGILSQKLASVPMQRKINRPIKEGYTLALSILKEGKPTHEGIKDLPFLQSRFIADMANDYLQGDVSQEAFLGIQLK